MRSASSLQTPDSLLSSLPVPDFRWPVLKLFARHSESSVCNTQPGCTAAPNTSVQQSLSPADTACTSGMAGHCSNQLVAASSMPGCELPGVNLYVVAVLLMSRPALRPLLPSCSSSEARAQAKSATARQCPARTVNAFSAHITAAFLLLSVLWQGTQSQLLVSEFGATVRGLSDGTIVAPDVKSRVEKRWPRRNKDAAQQRVGAVHISVGALLRAELLRESQHEQQRGRALTGVRQRAD